MKSMKISRHFLVLYVIAFCLVAQLPLLALQATSDEKQAKYRKNLQAKLAKKFVKSGSWLLDYKTAKARAAKEDKLLFVYFTRSFAP